MNDKIFYKLCTKKLTASITPEEEEQWSKFLEQYPDKKEVYIQLKKKWELSGQLKLNIETDLQSTWEKFSKLKSNHQPKTVRWADFAYRLAAMIVLTIGLGFLFIEFGKSEPEHYATFEGETKWVFLPDSSRVRMNESSLLSVSADFNEEERSVKLKGEAFFEIAKNADKPFYIETFDAYTRVLGTSFNIRALKDEPDVNIYVVSGKVSFSTDDSELILTPGMSANYTKNSQTLAMNETSENELAWHSQQLKFNDALLSQVFKDLEAYFKIEISVTNSAINNCRFTGEFDKPDLEEILKVLSISLDFTYTKGDTYTIRGAGCVSNN